MVREFFVVASVLVWGASIQDRAREIRVLMGTVAEIQVAGVDEPGKILASAFARIEEVEASLSIWKETSEIARLNESGDAVLSGRAFEAVERSLEVARASDGAFDPTLTRNGYARVALVPDACRVRLPQGLTLDLGAIAKGYAVDEAIAELREVATRGLVDLGTSSIALFGDDPVVFDVRDPNGGLPPATFRLHEGAIGSSSRDQQGDHIRDPRTGKSPSEVRAVTIVSPSALEADALSTAVFAMGAHAGLTLVEQRGAEGLVLLSGSSGYVVRATEGFVERYALEVAEGVEIELSSETEER
jgi:thiamine biosynthesis lipoprotein